MVPDLPLCAVVGAIQRGSRIGQLDGAKRRPNTGGHDMAVFEGCHPHGLALRAIAVLVYPSGKGRLAERLREVT
jgi:hypothetical protein